MKRYIYLTILILLGLKAIAQNNCEHNVSTKFDAPSNTSLPSGNTQFLNNFNWNESSGSLLLPYQLENMQYNQNMVNIMSDQMPSYYSYIYNGEQLTYENGWELLLLNLGKFPNGDPNIIFQDHADIPYIVLYNRYSSIIRVFANYGDGFLSGGTSIDAMRLSLTFDGTEVNGLLRLNNGLDRALDEETNVTKSTSLAFHPNQPNKWFSADFQVAYDPCICDHSSRLRLNFWVIQNINLELHGRAISIEQNLIEGSAINSKDFLSNFDYTGLTAEGGMVMYKAMDFLVEDYIAKTQKYKDDLALTNEHNKEVEFNLAVVKLFNTVVLKGGSKLISDYIFDPIYENLVDEMTSKSIFKQDSVRLQKLEEYTLKAFNFGVGKLNTFVSKNFKKMDNPTKPISPTATFSEMHFQGHLSDETEIQGPNFYTPGTYGSPGTGSPNLTSVSSYPVYNDALGTFALLETPKISISQSLKNITDQITIEQEYDDFAGQYVNFNVNNHFFTRYYQFKLQDDLKYTINSALDVKTDGVKIQAAFVIKPKLKAKPGTNLYTSFAYNDGQLNANLKASNLDLSTYKTFYNYFNESYGLKGSPQINYPQGKNPDVTTEFVPINAFYSNISSIGLRNYFYKYEYDPNLLHYYGWEYEFDVELKLIVEIEFNTLNSEGEPNSVTQILTYKVPNDAAHMIWQSTDIFPNLEGSTADLTQYPENLTFLTTNFNGSAVNGCILVGNHYTCQAWNEITINGNLSTGNGYTVNIFAGQEINELPESVVDTEIIREIKPMLNFSHPMPESDAGYVYSFCNGLNTNEPYQANQSNGKLAQHIAAPGNPSHVDQNAKNNNPLDFTLHPNPSNSETRLILQNHDPRNTNVSVVDLTGKVISVQLVKMSENSYGFDVSGLENGVYFVTVNSNFQQKTKQLIVQ